MAGISDSVKQHFPIESSYAVVELFKKQLEGEEPPDLAFLSIVAGSIENTLTVSRVIPNQFDATKNFKPIFPVLELSTVEALYCRFVSLVKGSVDLTHYTSGYATRNLVKKVSDVIWNSLTRSYYKDKAHLQSLYSFLTGNKLDCFGLAFAVVAACQVLGYNDVHLALSEDHAWVVFGEGSQETAEVTWHGKGNEDKRGQPINVGVEEKSWLYLNGHPVVCNRSLEVAALVSSINPALSAGLDSVELATLQQSLLWMMYDMGTLERYPMALGNLGDLEEMYPSREDRGAEDLFLEAVQSAKRFYSNMHVYPYTYLGSYYYRRRQYKKALKAWADAGDVIKKYNYNREDEEVYKEFLEVAIDLIPHMVKESVEDRRPGQPSILGDPESYSYLLRLYDGICQWEEESSTPVLHIGWAKQLVFCLSKFDSSVRGMCGVEDTSDEEEDEDKDDEKIKGHGTLRGERRASVKENLAGRNGVEVPVVKPKRGPGRPPKNKNDPEKGRIKQMKELSPKENGKKESVQPPKESMETKVRPDSLTDVSNPNIDALAKACGDAILNPEYLLGGGDTTGPFTSTAEGRMDFQDLLSSTTSGSPFPGMTMDSVLAADSPADLMLSKSAVQASAQDEFESDELLKLGDTGMNGRNQSPRLELALCSAKMKGLQKLLTNPEKFNANAIKLQLTAQSQVHLKHSRISSEYTYGSSRKRARRD